MPPDGTGPGPHDRPTAGRASEASERLEAIVRGRVQGVGFRYFVIDRARRLDLGGWVANEPDGSVRCLAEGPRPRLEQLLAALEAGPSGARVDVVERSWQPARGLDGPFGVRSGGHRGD